MRFDQHPGRNCANGDTEAWFPPRTDIRANRAATALCNGCPVINECLEFALAAEAGMGASGREGIFGGLTPAERARLVRGQTKPIRHGTEAGYRKHHRRGESPCGACMVAASKAKARRESAA